jgi:hypothetical protein
MKKVMIGLVLVMLFVVLSGCGETATVTGYIMAPNGEDPVVGATVSVKGKGISTTTNGTGRYTLANVPTGKQTLQAVKGNFRVEFTVSVHNSGTPIEAPIAKMTTKKIAVVKGDYDNIGAVLTNLGLSYTEFDSIYDLSASSVLDDYSVIFLACGGSSELYPDEFPDDEVVYNNLRLFVAEGGGIYGSDWSAATIASLFSEYVSLVGYTGLDQDVTATVLDNDIRALLGKNNCAIRYDLGSWALIAVQDSTKVSVDMIGDVSTSGGDVGDSPLLVEFSHGSGTVILTTFHNEEQVTADGLKVIKHLVFSL